MRYILFEQKKEWLILYLIKVILMAFITSIIFVHGIGSEAFTSNQLFNGKEIQLVVRNRGDKDKNDE